MREAFFIFLVILVLFGLTAFRYRRRIFWFLDLMRAVKSVGGAISQGSPKSITAEQRGNGDTALVNCSTCGVWTPQTRARQLKGKFYCSDECLASRVR